MPEKALLVFDFDGVIVDGISEYWSSSQQAFFNLLSDKKEQLFFSSTEVPENFKLLRPWVHHGWEMVLLAAECSHGTSRLNIRGVETFTKHYSKECSLALSHWEWTPHQLQEALNQSRRDAISNNFDKWLTSHKPVSTVVKRLKILNNEDIEFCVLTTKSLEFTKKLLSCFDLQPQFVFGHESGSKPEVLTELLKKRRITGFIEDRRTTLETVIENPKLHSIPCYLANWGYLKPQDLKYLPSGIRLLDLKTLSAPVANWP